MEGKGQISLYLFLGVVLILFFVLGLIFQSFPQEISLVEDTVSNTGDFAEAEGYIQHCLDTASKDAVLVAGRIGGIQTEESFDTALLQDVAYHYQKTWVNVPSVNSVSQTFGTIFDEMFAQCILEAEILGSAITLSQKDTTVTIYPDAVQFSLTSEISVIKGIESETILGATVTVDSVHVPHLLSVSEKLGEIQKKYPTGYCHSCISILALENYVWIDFEEYDGNAVYTITDLRSLLYEQPYDLVVAHEH